MKKVMGRYMVKSPFVIEPTALAREALETMRDLEIRHLPVVEEGALVGLVSERDLTAAVAKIPSTKISQVMRTELYTVPPTAILTDVIGKMIDEKIGSALVVSEDAEVLGIFTTIDALRILFEMLDQEGENLIVDDYFEEWTEVAM